MRTSITPARPALPSNVMLVAIVMLGACRDVQRFSTAGDHFEGTVVGGSFVRSGIVENTRVCLTLDTEHLQDTPGALSSSDGRFHATALRPIPQLWHDPLSTLSFGEDRIRNMVYAVAPVAEAGSSEDILAIVSLMQSNGVELRLLRGAPVADAGPPSNAIFGVFTLERKGGTCSF